MTFHRLTRRHFLHTTGAALALPLLESPARAADVPQTLAELWAGFEPRKDPLEIEVLKEWEQGSVVCRLLRYQIGIFKQGQDVAIAQGYLIHVAVDRTSQTPTPIPEHMRAVLEAIQI